MQERLIELSVGETLHVGEYTVTVVAVEGDELSFEIREDGHFGEADLLQESGDMLLTLV